MSTISWKFFTALSGLISILGCIEQGGTVTKVKKSGHQEDAVHHEDCEEEHTLQLDDDANLALDEDHHDEDHHEEHTPSPGPVPSPGLGIPSPTPAAKQDCKDEAAHQHLSGQKKSNKIKK